MREISSCCCLTVLPGPAWLLLNKICIPFSRSLYIFLLHRLIMALNKVLCRRANVQRARRRQTITGRRASPAARGTTDFSRAAAVCSICCQCRSNRKERLRWSAFGLRPRLVPVLRNIILRTDNTDTDTDTEWDKSFSDFSVIP